MKPARGIFWCSAVRTLKYHFVYFHIAHVAIHIGNGIPVFGSSNLRTRKQTDEPSKYFESYKDPKFTATNLTLAEAFKSKLNLDNLYTSVFKADGTMITLSIEDMHGFSTYDCVKHGTPIALICHIEVKFAAKYCGAELIIDHLYVLDDTPRPFSFPKLETAVSSASSTPTKSPKKRNICDV